MGFRAASLPNNTTYAVAKLQGIAVGDEFQDEHGFTYRCYQLDDTADLTASVLTKGDVCYLCCAGIATTQPLVVGNTMAQCTGGAQNYAIFAGIAPATIDPAAIGTNCYVFLLVHGRIKVNTGDATASVGDYMIFNTSEDTEATNVAQTDTTAQTLDLIPRHIGRCLVASSGGFTDSWIDAPLTLRG